jgi:hypothetical protein
MSATVQQPLNDAERTILEHLLADGGYGSSGALEHRYRNTHSRDALREAWQSLVERGVLAKDGTTTRSNKKHTSYYLKVVVDIEEMLERATRFAVGVRSRISDLASRVIST